MAVLWMIEQMSKVIYVLYNLVAVVWLIVQHETVLGIQRWRNFPTVSMEVLEGVEKREREREHVLKGKKEEKSWLFV